MFALFLRACGRRAIETGRRSPSARTGLVMRLVASCAVREDWHVNRSDQETGLRLAELVASLSLATDLGLGLPMEHALRACLVAMRLAERVGLDESQRVVVYYVGLLASVGCHANAHEQAALFGDDIAFKADVYMADAGPEMRDVIIRHIAVGAAPRERERLAASFLTSDVPVESRRLHCQVAGQFALRLGLGGEVQDALQHMYESWDGNGPLGLRGDQVALATRLVQLALVAEAFRRVGGFESAVGVARSRRGTKFDPEMVDAMCAGAPEILAGLDAVTSWRQVVDAEPALRPTLSEQELDRALYAIADFADLKSPYTLGHSRGVAELAAEAARRSGLSDAEVARLRWAGLIHDVGRLGVSNGIWDKPGPLSGAELERVRMHPYLTHRIFSASPLASLAELAAAHHERLDGSGYPRGLAGGALGLTARMLAAADVYHAMTEPRPHRPALTSEDAANELRAEVRSGRLDGEAVDAVLGAAGHTVRRRREWPAGLTAREVEVLALLARGQTNKQIAQRLVVAPKTVASHVEHIYVKVGCSSRAGAGLFAMEHGLLQPPATAEK
jgi:HD-GYP domain-containing protein (c-di-GMP phosphodiesterase class II)